MRPRLTDTWGQLPAVTLPLPIPSGEALGELATDIAGMPGMPDMPDMPGTLDGARWSRWGAAREGAHVTLERRQIVGFGVGAALLVLVLVLSPHALGVAAAALVSAAYLGGGAYKIWLLLRGERAIGAAALA